MLWEHEPQASVSTAFSSSPKLSRVLENWAGRHGERTLRLTLCARKVFFRAQCLIDKRTLEIRNPEIKTLTSSRQRNNLRADGREKTLQAGLELFN